MLFRYPQEKASGIFLSLAVVLAGLSFAPGPGLAADGRSDLDALLGLSADPSARRDQRGTAVTAAGLRDRVVFAAFVSVDCGIACVVRTRDLDRAARALPEALRTRVAFLCLDTDPARDDAGRLRAFADGLVGEDSPLRFLTSDAAGTAAVAARLGYPADALPEPPPTVVAFDRRGQIAMTYGADPLDGERLLRDAATLDTFEQGVGRPATAPVGKPSSNF